MARSKNTADCVKTKRAIALRLRSLRHELFGERGGPEMARQLGLPVRTWYNYESGVTVPAEVALRVVELTSVNPSWLLHGSEPKYRESRPAVAAGDPRSSAASLIRAALEKLEQSEAERVVEAFGPAIARSEFRPRLESGHAVAIEDRDDPGADGDEAPADEATAPNEDWSGNGRRGRCLRVEDQSMTPIVDGGAYVAFSDEEEDATELDGKLVVAWLGGKPVVRWFQHSGQYAVLRAENPQASPSTLLVDLRGEGDPPRFRRVLWVSTRHG